MDLGARSGKVCLIAKDSRIHAKRPRHPWRGRFALQAYHSFPVGLMHRFRKQDRGLFIGVLNKTIALDKGAGSGKVCLIAKDSRIHADRPRHPWHGRFALQAYLSFPVGLMHRFYKQTSGLFYWCVNKTIALDEGAGSGKVCMIAKDSRIHADRPRHPWRGRFALQAYHSFPVGLDHGFKNMR
ncbi:hypothetical protein [Pantoea agglomerans]|uniref:hypothetical protein n=1 Tax=Enterobacter agglomerans TaxID=549 RepID=UPI00301E3ACD